MARETPELQTPRLRLRAWYEGNLPPFTQLNADERVNEHLFGPLTRTQSDALVGRITKHFLREGFGFWAVEAPSVASFIGMVGIAIPSYTAPFTPCVEVGWHAYWTALKGAVPGGKGLGRAGASRLVCMKRPDYFVSVNNRSAFSNLAVQFGIKASDLNDVDNYWATVIAPMMLTPWWVDDRPADHKQADVWDFRAALVDILVKD